MSDTNTVSVIIPTYNRAERLERTLASVVDQDYKGVEIIVVDDGSHDDTSAVVRRVSDGLPDEHKVIRYVRQDNSGACVARNRGMMLATGKYLMFLDSDDLICPTKISAQVHQLENEGSQCSICDYIRIDDKGAIISRHSNDLHPHEFIRNFISPHISTVLIRRDSIPPGLQWNTKLKRLQDLDFVFKYLSTAENFSYLAQPLFQYCIHSGERISDSYSLGIQYDVLRDSFRCYLENSNAFVATESRGLYDSYMLTIRKHQMRDLLSRSVPPFVKKTGRMFIHGIRRMSQ